MNPIIKNIIAVVVGVLIGGVMNMGIVMISGHIIPPPPGADLTTPEGLIAAMPLMQPKHFLMPFLAHGIGTLVAAFIAAKFAASNNMRLALACGVFFLVGGIAAAKMIPAPMWFIVTDLVLEYIPMGYLGGKLAGK